MKASKLRSNKYALTIMLASATLLLLLLNIQKYNEPGLERPKNIAYDKETNTIDLKSMSLRQKIAQMIITFENDGKKKVFQNMLIGGVHLKVRETKEQYAEAIQSLQNNSVVPFFLTVDLEGCLNPFENFKYFQPVNEIKTKEEAFQAGKAAGELLKELGISVNFAPVVELDDTIWNCRAFKGTPEEIAEKANLYINGLKTSNIIATAKHYPGKTLVISDPHKNIVHATIEDKDTVAFDKVIENGVPAVMVSHLIVDGSVDSELKPAIASEKLIAGLRSKFDGLVVTDEIRMLGLRDFYKDDTERMYIDLFKADNDIILNFDTEPKNLLRMIDVVENAVRRGEISEERIDNSVIKILRAKGLNVK